MLTLLNCRLFCSLFQVCATLHSLSFCLPLQVLGSSAPTPLPLVLAARGGATQASKVPLLPTVTTEFGTFVVPAPRHAPPSHLPLPMALSLPPAAQPTAAPHAQHDATQGLQVHPWQPARVTTGPGRWQDSAWLSALPPPLLPMVCSANALCLPPPEAPV